jgi:EmrB/QacA subfamily drug resistance transporter
VAVLALAPFMSSLDLFIVNLAFPAIGREFPSVGLGQLSWVLNAYTIVFAAALIPAGRFADRIGRRRMFAGGLALFTVGSLLCGLAPGVAWLVAARVVQALGAGAMVPASMSLLLAAVPASRRATALGSWSAVGALGAALGPVVGGVLVQLGWRWVFWVNLPVGVLAVVLSLRWLTESRDEARGRRPDLLGAAGLALSVGLVAWSLIEAPGRGWTSPAVLGALTGAVVLGSLTVLRSARHPAPVLELSLLRSRPMGGAVLASVLYYAGFGAFVLCAVEFLTGVWGYSPLRAGLAIAPGPLVVLPFARLVAPRLVGLLGGAGRVAAIGCGVNALAQGLWFLLLQVQPAYVTHLLPVQLLGGAGVGLAIPSLLGAGSAGFSAARLGTGSGILNMARQIGAVLGVAGLVAVLVAGGLDPLTPFRRAVLVIVGFFLAAGVVCVATLLRRPEEVR